MDNLFSTHPATDNRIAALQRCPAEGTGRLRRRWRRLFGRRRQLCRRRAARPRQRSGIGRRALGRRLAWRPASPAVPGGGSRNTALQCLFPSPREAVGREHEAPLAAKFARTHQTVNDYDGGRAPLASAAFFRVQIVTDWGTQNQPLELGPALLHPSRRVCDRNAARMRLRGGIKRRGARAARCGTGDSAGYGGVTVGSGPGCP